MSSTKPYLLRAIHEWCVDQGFTPYLSVAVDATTRVPREFVKDGEIVLNVGHDATHQLNMGNDDIEFQARFGGRPYPVVVPVERVLAIYARENGQGMAFEISEVSETPDQASAAEKAVAFGDADRFSGSHAGPVDESSQRGEEKSDMADINAATGRVPTTSGMSRSSPVSSSSSQRPFLTRVK